MIIQKIIKFNFTRWLIIKGQTKKFMHAQLLHKTFLKTTIASREPQAATFVILCSTLNATKHDRDLYRVLDDVIRRLGLALGLSFKGLQRLVASHSKKGDTI